MKQMVTTHLLKSVCLHYNTQKYLDTEVVEEIENMRILQSGKDSGWVG